MPGWQKSHTESIHELDFDDSLQDALAEDQDANLKFQLTDFDKSSLLMRFRESLLCNGSAEFLTSADKQLKHYVESTYQMDQSLIVKSQTSSSRKQKVKVPLLPSDMDLQLRSPILPQKHFDSEFRRPPL